MASAKCDLQNPNGTATRFVSSPWPLKTRRCDDRDDEFRDMLFFRVAQRVSYAGSPAGHKGVLVVPGEPPNTGGTYLTRALQKYLPSLLLTDGVAVPNDPEEMRWRLFFAYS